MPADNAPAHVVRFGVFQIDLRTGELRKSGVRIRLQEQPFQILAMLLERPGEVVSREDLRKKLWAEETFVDFDHGLNTAVQRLRDSLGDTAENPRFIETLPRRGYRFLVPVSTDGSSLQTTATLAASQPSAASMEAARSEARALAGGTRLEPSEILASRRRIVSWMLAVVCAAAALWVAVILLGRRAANKPITIRQLTFRNGFVNGAMFAPDGHNIVYSALWDGKPPEIFLTTTESKESRSLGLHNAGLFSISSTGEMAVALKCQLNWSACYGTLARVSIAGGAPQELEENVYAANWSSDGKELAVVHAVNGKYRLEYPRGKVLYESPGWIGGLSISPNGDMIAFDEHPRIPYISGWVAVVDLSGKRKILSNGWAALTVCEWSRADEVWFAGTRKGGINNEAIQAVTLAGKERTVWQGFGGLIFAFSSPDRRRVLVNRAVARAHISGIFGTSAAPRDLSWFDWSTVADLSADGKILLFYEWGAGSESGPTVYLRKTDGSEAVRLGDGRALALSPDGKWALALQEATQTLVMLPTSAGEQKTLPTGAVNEVYWASWVSNGREILFAGAEPGHHPRTYIHNLDSSTTVPVTIEDMVGVLVSPDSKLIAAYGPDGNYYLVPVGGGEPRAISGTQAGDTPIQWSGDGRSIYFREASDFEVRIYRLDLRTGRRSSWLKSAPADPVGMFGIAADPRGLRMTPDGKTIVYTYWSSTGELYLLEGLK